MIETRQGINLSDIARVIVEADKGGYKPMLYINGEYYAVSIDLTEEEYDNLAGKEN